MSATCLLGNMSACMHASGECHGVVRVYATLDQLNMRWFAYVFYHEHLKNAYLRKRSP